MGKKVGLVRRTLTAILVLTILASCCLTVAACGVEKVAETLVPVSGVKSGFSENKGKFYTDYATKEEQQVAAQKVSIRLAEEGFTLLKNADNALPLKADENKLTLFGIHSVNMIRGGIGSGAGSAVNSDVVDPSQLPDALESAGFSLNQRTLALYERFTTGTGDRYQRTSRIIDPELPQDYYTPSVVGTYSAFNDAAILTFSRIGAENIDLLTNSVPGRNYASDDNHYLELDLDEQALIKHAKQHFGKVIVLINSSNIMQIPELAEEKTAENLGVDAIIWVGGVGNNGADAIASILKGDVNPSGHTVDLWAKDFKKAPTWTNVGRNSQNKDENGNRLDVFYYENGGAKKMDFTSIEYREDIYMGYRYYETKATDMNAAKKGTGDTWYNEEVLYPFGYGLSYTNFKWELDESINKKANITAANETVTLKVKVTNTGSVAGKDVVQIYYTAPYTKGGIEKASTNLVEFGKTKLLEPGESEVLTIQFVAQDMASFDWDDKNSNDFKGYELEKGDYTVAACRNSHEPVLTVKRTLKNSINCETDYTSGNKVEPLFTDKFTSVNSSLLSNLVSRENGLEQPKAASKADRTLSQTEAQEFYDQKAYYPHNDKSTDPWYVSSVPSTWNQAVRTTGTAAELLRGGVSTSANDFAIKLQHMSGIKYTEPSKNASGAMTAPTDADSKKWEDFMNQFSYEELRQLASQGTGIGGRSFAPYFGVASDNNVEGSFQISAGMLWPTAPITSATYNRELSGEMGRQIGNEGLFGNGTNPNTNWHGPAVNTHRSPFGGRNFEYYSEDGVQAAKMIAPVALGVYSKGVNATIKHFFLNDQESYRADFGGIATWATEQAMREIYLKPFEAAFKQGRAQKFMSSFNRIGKQVTATNYAVHERLLRQEWGFFGASVTDAWARDYVPLNMMVRGGDSQPLGGGDTNWPLGRVTEGVWDAAAKTVKVPTIDTPAANTAYTTTVASPTHYYAIRKSAQRILYTRANAATVRNGFINGAQYDMSLTAGIFNSLPVEISNNKAATINLGSGASWPENMSVTNGRMIGNPNLSGSTRPTKAFTDATAGLTNINTAYVDVSDLVGTAAPVNVTINADSWVNSNAVMNFKIESALHFNGTPIGKELSIKSGQTQNAVVNAPDLKYMEKMRINSNTNTDRIINFYENPELPLGQRYWHRDEDKSAADVLTQPVSNLPMKYEYKFKVEGLPAGLSWVPTYETIMGFAGRGSYDVNTSGKVTGSTTATGDHSVTITLFIPWIGASSPWMTPGRSFTGPTVNYIAYIHTFNLKVTA